MKTVICNTFSLAMILNHLASRSVQVTIDPITNAEAGRYLQKEFVSSVGHQDACDKYSNLLGVIIPFNRVSVTLDVGDILIVGQFTGNRLIEGATSIDNPEYVWLRITIR